MRLDLAIFAALNRSIAAPIPPTLERVGFSEIYYERQFQITSGKSSKYWYKKKLEAGKLKLGLADDMDTDGVDECDRSNPVDINTGSISIHPALQPNTN